MNSTFNTFLDISVPVVATIFCGLPTSEDSSYTVLDIFMLCEAVLELFIKPLVELANSPAMHRLYKELNH